MGSASGIDTLQEQVRAVQASLDKVQHRLEELAGGSLVGKTQPER